MDVMAVVRRHRSANQLIENEDAVEWRKLRREAPGYRRMHLHLFLRACFAGKCKPTPCDPCNRSAPGCDERPTCQIIHCSGSQICARNQLLGTSARRIRPSARWVDHAPAGDQRLIARQDRLRRPRNQRLSDLRRAITRCKRRSALMCYDVYMIVHRVETVSLET